MKYKDSQGNFQDIYVKVGDNIPVGGEMDFDGNTVPVGWEEVDYDTGWQTLTLLNGHTAYSGQTVPAYRKIGNQIYLRGVIRCNGNETDRTFATLPNPTTAENVMYFPICMNNGSTRTIEQLQVSTSGNLWRPGNFTSEGMWLSLDGTVITL